MVIFLSVTVLRLVCAIQCRTYFFMRFHKIEFIQSTHHFSTQKSRHLFDNEMTRHHLSLAAAGAVFYAFFLSCLSSHTAASKTAVRDALLRSLSLNSFARNERGKCCPSADVQSRQACRFMKPRSLLINAPGARPEEFGGPCLAYERNNEPLVRPTYSVLLSSFNAATRLPAVITQLLKLTRGDWEFIYLCDACTDNSFDVVRSLLEQSQSSSNGSWPSCPYGEDDINQAAIWQTGVNLTTYQGDIGRECHLSQKGRLTRAAMIDVQGAELLETAANNVLMLSARAPFLILLQDDQLMTQPGWNVALTTPLTTWPDVFSVSARCAHPFDFMKQGGHLTGAKCWSTLQVQPKERELRCCFYVRDTGNRGPLAVRASYAHRIGYFDETRFFGGGDDDHEMNLRAYARHGWVSGHAPIDYTEERCCRSPAMREDGGALTTRYREWLSKRMADKQADASSGAYGAAFDAFVQSGHDANRTINNDAFWKGCGASRKSRF